MLRLIYIIWRARSERTTIQQTQQTKAQDTKQDQLQLDQVFDFLLFSAIENGSPSYTPTECESRV